MDTDNADRKPGGWFNGDMRIWLPLLISMLTTLFSIGLMSGRLGGRLDLIEYRLHQIELKAGIQQ